jgi:glycosyltransferase involved in cell wall biosynthesis
MKILMLHQHFRTPDNGGAIRSFHVANALADAGHNVTIITAGSSKTLVKLNSRIIIHYLPVSYSNHLSFYSRIYSFIKFYWLAYFKALNLDNIDVVYAISTPITVGSLGKWLKKKFKCSFIFEVGDLWPEAPIKIGAIKNRWLAKLLYEEEARIYRASDAIISLSPDITHYINKKIAGAKVFTIPNMADLNFFESAIKKETSDTFTIGYFGTIGEANAIEYLINAAYEAQNQKLEVRFLIMGTGKKKHFAMLECERLQLENIDFLEFTNHNQMRLSLKKCDAIYVSFRDIPVLATGSPNKFFDGLASGKIIILNFGGWVGNLVIKHRIGFSYDPLVPSQFCKKLKSILDNPEEHERIKANALQLARNQFDKDLLTKEIVEIVESLHS